MAALRLQDILTLQKRRWARMVCVVALLLLQALQLVHVARATSSSWDEPHHLLDGYTIWKFDDYRLNPEVPPLIKLTAALPLLGMRLTVPPNLGREDPTEAFLDGKAFVFGNGGDRVLFPARMAAMSYALALGLLIYLFAEEMFGFVAGIFALAMFVFDPNFLAHGAMVTTDVGAACCFLASVYSFYRYCRRPGWLRLGVAGVALGLTLSAKYTGIFLLPILALIVLLEAVLAAARRPAALQEQGSEAAGQGAFSRIWSVLWRRSEALLAMGLIAWAVVWSFYGFRYRAAPAGKDLNPPLAEYLTQMRDQRDARMLGLLAHDKLLPEGYLWGLENTKQIAYDDTSYFWGKVYPHGNWEYFPVALLIKSALPFLMLLGLTPLAWRWGRRRILAAPAEVGGEAGAGSEVEFAARDLIFLLSPIAVYLAISMSANMDIGIRHMLPVYAFLYVLVGGTAMLLLRWDLRWAGVLAVLLAWQVVTSVQVSPAYMAYGNRAWGGPDKVDRYLGDANTDWGQQLKAVKAYLDQRHITDCWFVYFPDGSIDPMDYGIPCRRLPTANLLWWLDLPVQVPPVISGTVLISASDLEGIEFGDGKLNPYGQFWKIKPLAVIQHGVYVYQGTFRIPLAAALAEAQEAEDLSDDGQWAPALAKAEDAARLAPDSGQVADTLGDVLAADGQKAAALAEYQRALQLRQSVRPDLQVEDIAQLKGKIAQAQGSAGALPAPGR